MNGSGKRHLIQGEYAIGRDPEFVISTVLGSCVSACLRDPKAGIGGMNHFLLPGRDGERPSVQHGAYAMELLINALLKAGAQRDRLQAKLFGGAQVVAKLSDIGRMNGEFAVRFLKAEGIPHLGGSLYGTAARRVLYWPGTGVVRQQLLPESGSIFSQEARGAPPEPNDIELFAA